MNQKTSHDIQALSFPNHDLISLKLNALSVVSYRVMAKQIPPLSSLWLLRIPPQLPGQRQVLLGDVEEEHADVLAAGAVPGRGRAGNPAEGGEIRLRTWRDDEERPLAHWRHLQPGQSIGG